MPASDDVMTAVNPSRLLGSLALVLLVTSAFLASSNRPHASRSVASDRLVIAAAADLKFALDEIITEFKRVHPLISVEVTYGSSGNFFSQLLNQAPFDIFFSADAAYPRKLQTLGLEGSYALYALGRIVVWTSRSSPVDVRALGMNALLDKRIQKIAIANPRHAPYGRAAEAAMKFFGVYERLKDKLIYGENVAQTAQFIQTGAADAGIVALSLALAPSLRETGIYFEIPPKAYPKIEQALLILRWARDVRTARAFQEFVLGAKGRAALKRYGFDLPRR